MMYVHFNKNKGGSAAVCLHIFAWNALTLTLDRPLDKGARGGGKLMYVWI